jgi:hypothetical protein
MSRYRSGLVAAAAIAAAAALGAQGQNPANTPPADAGAPAGVQRTTPMASGNTASRDGRSSTAAGSGSATGSASGNTTARAATGTQFVLNAAPMTAEGKAPGPVGTSGTASTSYQLQGDAETLSPHVNHRVEITGTLQSSAASATGAANARTGATASGPTVRVDSVKMLADKCDTAASTTTAPAEPIAPAPAPTTEPRQQ